MFDIIELELMAFLVCFFSDDDDDDDYDDVKPAKTKVKKEKTKVKKEKTQTKVKTENATQQSPTKGRKKKVEEEQEVWKW